MRPLRSGLAWLIAALMVMPATALGVGVDSAASQARAWVHARGWRDGQRIDGRFVAIGTAPLDPSLPEPTAARQLAFELASLDAKNRLASLLGTEVSRESSLAQVQVGPVARACSQLPAGASPETLGVERFRDACWVVARAEICGLLTERAFFSPGEVAVVLRCDTASLELVAATAERRAVPAPPDAAPLEALRSAPDDELADTFGVRLARDVQGDACLVAFGQSQAAQEPLSLPRAAARAREAAVGALRRHLHERVLARSGLQDLTLQTVERARERLETTHRFLQRLQSESRPVEMATPTLREWVVVRDGRTTVGCAVLLGPGHLGADAALPSVGSGAVVDPRSDRLVATAIGFGCDTQSSSLPPTVRRSRAIRAAVVAAKGEIARALRQRVETAIVSRTSDEDGLRAASEVRTQVMRHALAGARVEWVRMLTEGDAPEACVRISIDASIDAPPGGGLLVFPSAPEGAEALARMALEGLCPPGALRAFVRTPGGLQPTTFAVGLGAGPSGQAQAKSAAAAELAGHQRSDLTGGVVTRSEIVYPDALSADGCSAAFQERLFSRWARQAWDLSFPSGQQACDRRGDLWSCVLFPSG